MTKQYLVENGCSLPLCYVDNDVYIDYLSGQVIDNKNVLNFIKEGLERKSMKIKDIDLVIYQIVTSGNINDRRFVAYNYVINGCSNYLSENKQPLTNDKRQYIVDKLMKGEYEQVIIWE